MKIKNWVLPGLIAILVASGFLFIGFSSHASAKKEKSTCCSQKMSAKPGGKGCDETKNSPATGDMILENFSRQFLSISPLAH
jgi:hypothetical protein